MKIVFFGYDATINVARRLLEDGHEILGIFTFECDNVFNFNRELFALAGHIDVPMTQKPITDEHIEDFLQKGAECFLASGYPHKIPYIDEARAYGINIHPSYLPKGRGLMPTPYILMDHSEAAGLSIHKITGSFDEGDVLMQRQLKLHDNETVETYSARLSMIAPGMVSTCLQNLGRLWVEAIEQNEDDASYFPPPDDKLRFLDWSQSIYEIDKKARAFGRYGCLANINGQLCAIYNHSIWEEAHEHAPGTLVCTMHNAHVVAAKGGFVCLKEFQVVAAQA